MHCLNLVLHRRRIRPPLPETIVSGGNQRGRKHTANDSMSQKRVKYTSRLVPMFPVNAGKYYAKFSQLDGDS